MKCVMGKKEDIVTSTTYLYFLRIIATVLVILLHCIMPIYNNIDYFETRAWWICGVLNSISRTAVPIFFMMSGFLMLNNSDTLDIKGFYKKRVPHLLIPLLMWNIIYYLYNNYQSLSVAEFFKQLINTGSSYHLWFVYTMIGFYLLMPFLKRITDNCTLPQLWVFTVIILFTSTIRPFLNTVLPIYINLFDGLTNGYIPYMILGYLLGKSKFDFKSRVAVYIGGVIGLLMSLLGNWYFSSQDKLSLIFNEAYRINHILCASAVFVLFKQIKWDKFNKLSQMAKFWSKRTFGIYFIHAMILDIYMKYVWHNITPMWLIVCSFLFTILISFTVIFIADKIRPLRKLLM